MIIFLIFNSLALIQAKITVTINLSPNKSDIIVKYSGNDYKIVTPSELHLFNVTTENLKKGMKIEMGKAPDDIFLNDPTYYGNIFKKFRWEPVKRRLTVSNAKIVDVLNEDIVLKSQVYINNTTMSLESKRSLYETIENTARSSWYIGGLPNDYIVCNIDLNFGYGHFKYENKWRNDTLHATRMSTGVTKKGLIEIKSYGAVEAKLFATKTIVLIELEYTANLIGAAVANYARLYGKYHFWAPSIQSIMKAAGMKNEIKTKELIVIRCFLNPRLDMYDMFTNEIMEPPRPKPPLVRILHNNNTNSYLYFQIKKPKKTKKINRLNASRGRA